MPLPVDPFLLGAAHGRKTQSHLGPLRQRIGYRPRLDTPEADRAAGFVAKAEGQVLPGQPLRLAHPQAAGGRHHHGHVTRGGQPAAGACGGAIRGEQQVEPRVQAVACRSVAERRPQALDAALGDVQDAGGDAQRVGDVAVRGAGEPPAAVGIREKLGHRVVGGVLRAEHLLAGEPLARQHVAADHALGDAEVLGPAGQSQDDRRLDHVAGVVDLAASGHALVAQGLDRPPEAAAGGRQPHVEDAAGVLDGVQVADQQPVVRQTVDRAGDRMGMGAGLHGEPAVIGERRGARQAHEAVGQLQRALVPGEAEEVGEGHHRPPPRPRRRGLDAVALVGEARMPQARLGRDQVGPPGAVGAGEPDPGVEERLQPLAGGTVVAGGRQLGERLHDLAQVVRIGLPVDPRESERVVGQVQQHGAQAVDDRLRRRRAARCGSLQQRVYGPAVVVRVQHALGEAALAPAGDVRHGAGDAGGQVGITDIRHRLLPRAAMMRRHGAARQ